MYYRIMIVSAFVLGLSFAAYALKRKKVPARIIALSIIMELILSVYFALMTTFIISRSANIGLNSTGAALGMLLGIVIFEKIAPQYEHAFWHAYTLVLPLMYGVGKIGCSIAGCCGGIPYTGILHVHTKSGDAFPIQRLEAVVFLLLFVVSLVFYVKERFDPIIGAIIFSAVKIGLDFFRETHIKQVITSNQIMCAAVIVLLLVIMCCSERKGSQRL